MGKIIAVTNQKGGVGKTTTAVNLAACLAYKGKRVLVADCDPQGNATSGMGINKENIEFSVYDCLVDNEKTKEAVIKTTSRGLSVIASLPELSAAEIELASQENREQFLKRALDTVKNDYDYIIIDAPPALGMLTINIMTAADSVLIPASSPGWESKIENLKPCCSAQRVYIRTSIWAQSHDSVPPAPA